MKSLAIKYRPKTFDDVVEQGSVKKILQEQLISKTHKNCYLFTGGAGTGKTTCARIFANEINNHEGNPIEIDAASNNGVENVRDIIDNAKFKSLDSEYKVYIIDECFHKDTPISLSNGGSLPIKDINIGDSVLNMTGKGVVKNIFKNLIPLHNLCIIRLTDGSQMLTTKDHLFFTNNGWIEAHKLCKEDIIYEDIKVSDMWDRVSKQDCPQNLLKGVHEDFNISDGESDDEQSFRADAAERVFKTDEGSESNVSQREYPEDGRNQNFKRDTQSDIYAARGERSVYSRAVDTVSDAGGSMAIRISNSYKDSEGKWIPNLLQSRPCLSGENDSSRGGWESPLLEKEFIKRCKENSSTGELRVEGVEVYQPANPSGCFEHYIGDREKHSGFIEMYDLEVSGHSSYFANKILVHNCHMLSTGAWNAMLKLIEEPPAQTVFIFCTTDPQKIPATIISRVQRYDFQRITYQSVVDRLKQILDWETQQICEIQGNDINPGEFIDYDDEALGYIAKLADGGMRDAITLLDKCVSFDYNLTVENVVEALGTIDYEIMFKLTNSLIDGYAQTCVEIIEESHRRGIDLKQFMKLYMHFLLDAYKYFLIGNFEYLQIPSTYEEQLNEYDDVDYERIKLLLDEMVKLNSDIKWEPGPKPLIEATLILFCQEL